MNDVDRIELKKIVETRTWMVNDARLFTWAKCAGRLKEMEKLGIGGGNFLVTLGLFSILNFLSKVYYLLQSDAALWTKEEVEDIKKALKNCPDTKGASPPFVGSPKRSEMDCFIKFALALEFPLFSGVKDLSKAEQTERYIKIWGSYRNKLAHMAMPDQAAISIDFADREYEGINGVAELLDGNTESAFVKDGDRYAVYTDLFARDIEKWVGWLKLEIDNQKFSDERIIATLNWIKGV